MKPQLVARLSKVLKTEENESLVAAENQNESNAADGDETHATSGDGVTSGCGSNDLHESASNDSIDIDMADIVVIDEYDSTKNDNKNESSSKRVWKFIFEKIKKLNQIQFFSFIFQSSSKKLDEREQRWLEKRYRLPENPQILCHPVQQCSLEKFTCELRSLSLLLDYRPEDSKKHCFEVSLFAELFNEMLIRDFGFNIYKVLHAMPETESAASEQSDAKDRHDKSIDDEPKEKRHRRDSMKSSKRDEASTGHDKTKSDADKEKDSKSASTGGSSSNTKSRDKDRDKEHRREGRTSRRDDDNNSDDERSMDSKKRESKKMITVDPDLLLSFIYFDQTYCGYIFSNHLEELFYALGLRLSRADAKKIINKVAPRSLFYR